MTRQYWLDLFTVETWKEFLAAGATVSGFRERRWSRVQRMAPGDYLLCYLTGVSRFLAVLEVTSQPFMAIEPKIWSEDFPSRVNVRVISQLTPETAVPVHELLPALSFFDPNRPHAWTGRVRGSPERWSTEDGEVIVKAINEAIAYPTPIVHPVRKERAPKRENSERLGPVTIPDNDQSGDSVNPALDLSQAELAPLKDERAHSEIQWLLLKLGNDMGLDVWVARNDRGRQWRGVRFADLPRLRSEIPRQFDNATHSTIELIDVLWLRTMSIVAAFEIESTTSIYSGLLRMSDLIAMQPNINIPLYLVAPDERRKKVREEITRPTFSRMNPPLKQVCRYLAFSTIRERFPIEPYLVRYLNPNFIDALAESFDDSP